MTRGKKVLVCPQYAPSMAPVFFRFWNFSGAEIVFLKWQGKMTATKIQFWLTRGSGFLKLTFLTWKLTVSVELHSDCQAVVDGYHKGKVWTRGTDLSGIWEELWALLHNIHQKGITLKVHEVKAHTGLTDDISPIHRMGNDIANREAKHAAYDHDLPKAETDWIK